MGMFNLLFNFNWVTTIVIITTIIIIILMLLFPKIIIKGSILIGAMWLFMWLYNIGENIGTIIKENTIIMIGAVSLIILFLILKTDDKK